MFLTACLVAASLVGTSSPDAVYKLAALDLAERVPPDKRQTTRYLSLHAVPEADRPDFLKALVFTLNSVSFRSRIIQPVVVGGEQLLVRVDLEAFAWDRNSRTARRDRLAQSGVKFSFPDAVSEQRFLDIWEDFVASDPYFKVTQVNAAGKHVRGWLDPVVEAATRKLSQSSSFILRADWLLPRLLIEKDQGGFYSQTLMFPANETDLYKYFGVDINLVDRENQLKAGGAVLESIVALHNRELQQIPSLYGWDEKFIWRTFDFAKDDEAAKNVLESFGGTAVHDGRELIGSLPNGLHWYYLSDAKGTQVAVVPQAIAFDMRNKEKQPIRDRNVVNSYKCIGCHGPVSGTYPFDDVVGKSILDPAIALAVISKDKEKAADRTAALEDYYLSDLSRKITRQQNSYADRILACNDLTPEVNTEHLIGTIDHYTWDLVTLEQAAREMGLTVDQSKPLLRVAGNSQLVVL